MTGQASIKPLELRYNQAPSEELILNFRIAANENQEFSATIITPVYLWKAPTSVHANKPK